MTDYRITSLDRRMHDRARFTCSNTALDRYLREQATQDVRAKVAAVFVMTPIPEPSSSTRSSVRSPPPTA